MASYVVTFTNEYTTAPGGALQTLNVTVDSDVEITVDNFEEHVDALVDEAVALINEDEREGVYDDNGEDEDDFEWEAVDFEWEAVAVTLPGGEVVDL